MQVELEQIPYLEYLVESKLDKVLREQRQRRAEVIIKGILRGKSAFKIMDDLKGAGLKVPSYFWVRQWVKHYQEKLKVDMN